MPKMGLARLKAKSKLRTVLIRHLATALSHSYPSASADSSALLLSHHRPLFLHLAPAGLAVLAVFLLFAFSALLPFWALPFWDCCLFRLPPPPAACSARPAGVALSISHLYPAPKHKWRHGNAGRLMCYARCCNARIRLRDNFISFAFGLSNDERMSWKIL